MSNRTYRVTEIVGTSPDGVDQAIRNGIQRGFRRFIRRCQWWILHGRRDGVFRRQRRQQQRRPR